MAKHRYKTHLQSVSYLLENLENLKIPEQWQLLLKYVTMLTQKYPSYNFCQCQALVEQINKMVENNSNEVYMHIGQGILWYGCSSMFDHVIDTNIILMWRICVSLFGSESVPRKRKNASIKLTGSWCMGICSPHSDFSSIQNKDILGMVPPNIGIRKDAKYMFIYLNTKACPIIHVISNNNIDSLRDISTSVQVVLVLQIVDVQQMVFNSKKRVLTSNDWQQLNTTSSARPECKRQTTLDELCDDNIDQRAEETSTFDRVLLCNVYLGIHTMYKEYLPADLREKFGQMSNFNAYSDDMQYSTCDLVSWEKAACAVIKAEEVKLIRATFLKDTQSVLRLISLQQLGDRLTSFLDATERKPQALFEVQQHWPQITGCTNGESQLNKNIEYLCKCMQWVRSKNGRMPKWRIRLYNVNARRMITGKSAIPCANLQKMFDESFNVASQIFQKFPYNRDVHLSKIKEV